MRNILSRKDPSTGYKWALCARFWNCNVFIPLTDLSGNHFSDLSKTCFPVLRTDCRRRSIWKPKLCKSIFRKVFSWSCNTVLICWFMECLQVFCDSSATNVANWIKIPSLKENVASSNLEQRLEKTTFISASPEMYENTGNIQRSVDKVLKDQDPIAERYNIRLCNLHASANKQ